MVDGSENFQPRIPQFLEVERINKDLPNISDPSNIVHHIKKDRL